jgi:hypothetical protein
MSFDLSEAVPYSMSPPANALNAASICALSESHRGEFERFLIALDSSSRCSRFGYAANDAALVAHSQSALRAACRMFGIFIEHKLAGVAEIYRCHSADKYEVLLVVDRPLQKRGLGWNLLSCSMQWARSANAESLRLVFSRHNWAMRKLAKRARATLDLSRDELNAEIPLSPGTSLRTT